MAGLTESEMLQELREFDTPAVTNVVATYPDSPLCLRLYDPWNDNWYTDQSLRCLYPDDGRDLPQRRPVFLAIAPPRPAGPYVSLGEIGKIGKY